MAENGVDGPARFASDGRLLVHADGDALRVYDVTGPAPVSRGLLDLQKVGFGAGEVLLAGSRALLIGVKVRHSNGMASSGPPSMTPQAPQPPENTWLAHVDLADPDRPVVLSMERSQGGFRTARLTGSTVRVVTALPAPFADRPWRQVFTGAGETLEPELKCTDVRHPAGVSRADMLVVETIDLGRQDALATASTTGVVGGTLAYNSPARLYVATTPARAHDPLGIHVFTAGPAPVTTYAAGAELQGHLRGAWAMSERGGHLRVLANDRPRAPVTTAENAGVEQRHAGRARVVVLNVADGQPRRVGEVRRVAGSSVADQVRWVDDVALVGTDHRLDPLRVVDLADPEHPALTGRLSTGGSFDYVHPIGGGHLLAVGTLAGGVTEQGEALHMGLQVADVDLADPATPRRASFLDYGIAQSHVGYEGGNLTYDADRHVTSSPPPSTSGRVARPACTASAAATRCPRGADRSARAPGWGAVATFRPWSRFGTAPAARSPRPAGWTGGEAYLVLSLGDRIAIVDYQRISLVDPVTLRPTGALVIGDLHAQGDDFPSLPKKTMKKTD